MGWGESSLLSLAWTTLQEKRVLRHASKLVLNLDVTKMPVQNLASSWLVLLCMDYNCRSCQVALAERSVTDAL